MKRFIEKNILITIIFILSTFIVISYEYTMEWPEIFDHGDFWYNLSSQLGISFMGCFIFYIMQVYIPERKTEKIRNDILKKDINSILNNMLYPVSKLFFDNTTRSIEDIENELKSNSEKLINDIDTYKGTSICRHKQELTNLEYMMENIVEIDKTISQILLAMGTTLDTKIYKLLHNLRDCKYSKTVIERYNTPIGQQQTVNNMTATIILEDIESSNKELLESISEYLSLYTKLKLIYNKLEK